MDNDYNFVADKASGHESFLRIIKTGIFKCYRIFRKH